MLHLGMEVCLFFSHFSYKVSLKSEGQQYLLVFLNSPLECILQPCIEYWILDLELQLMFISAYS